MVVLTRDRPKLLRECLESITRQTVRPVEVIIVDDSIEKKGETQRTIDTFRHKLPITTIQSPLKLIASARDSGAKKSHGDIIVYLDDDLEASPDYVRAIVGHFTNDPTVSAVMGKIINKHPDNIYASAQYAYYDKGLNYYFPHARTPQPVTAGRMLDCEVMGIRRLVIQKFGYPANRNRYRNEDVGLGIRLVKAGKKILFDPSITALTTPRTSLWPFLVVAFWNGYSDAYTNRVFHTNLRAHRGTLASKARWAWKELRRRPQFPKLSYLAVLLLFPLTNDFGRLLYPFVPNL